MTMQTETEAALEAIFKQALTKEAMANHLIQITTMTILALREIEGDEFMLGYLQGAIDDITYGIANKRPTAGSGRAH